MNRALEPSPSSSSSSSSVDVAGHVLVEQEPLKDEAEGAAGPKQAAVYGNVLVI